MANSLTLTVGSKQANALVPVLRESGDSETPTEQDNCKRRLSSSSFVDELLTCGKAWQGLVMKILSGLADSEAYSPRTPSFSSFTPAQDSRQALPNLRFRPWEM